MPYRTASRTVSRTGKRSYRPRHPRLAARTIQRTWRKSRARAANRKLFSRTEIGAPRASTTAKSAIINNANPTSRDSYTLYQLDLTALSQGIAINQRLRQHCIVSGFKIYMEVYANQAYPLYFNCAVVAPKETNGIVSVANFFRNNTDARSLDFSINRTGLEMGTCQINTDDYTVLKHKRYVLNTQGAPGTAYNKQYGTAFRNLTWYIPLRRQVRYFNGESANATDGRVYHLFWFARWQGSAPGGIAASATTSTRVITYFREPNN